MNYDIRDINLVDKLFKLFNSLTVVLFLSLYNPTDDKEIEKIKFTEDTFKYTPSSYFTNAVLSE